MIAFLAVLGWLIVSAYSIATLPPLVAVLMVTAAALLFWWEWRDLTRPE